MDFTSFMLSGVGVSKGYAFGNAVLFGKSKTEIPHYFIDPTQIETEIARLKNALAAVSSELKHQISDISQEIPEEIIAILQAHILIVEDPDLLRVSTQTISEKLYNAEWALSIYMQQISDVFLAMDDDYIRERIEDIHQVVDRIIDHLAGKAEETPPTSISSQSIQKDLIIVSRDISPAEMLSLRQAHFVGFCTDLGTPTSHTAIVARSIGVPAAVAMSNASLCIKDGDFLILDGFEGMIIVNPSKEIIASYQEAHEQYMQHMKDLVELIQEPIVSKQGERISLFANLDVPEESYSAIQYNADGVGLFRTEFLFMNRETIPSEEEQYQVYKQLLLQMPNKPVTIRTLDLGADKVLDNSHTISTNPALGLRAVRFCLSKPGLFAHQIRALLRASVHGELRILVPMITNLTEVQTVRNMISKMENELRSAHPELQPRFSFGIMVEVPACAISLDLFLPYIDFISIGTNDLIQYTLAIDRQDQEVAYLYDPMHPAIIHLLTHCIQSAKKAKIPVCVCGEVASDPKYIQTLLSLGLTEFSVPPHSLLEVRETLLNAQ